MQSRADAFDRQVGGNHYQKMPVQPFQFTLPNGWDGATHTILKYISRHHSVDRAEAIESLRKAIHVVEIRQTAIEQQEIAFAVCHVAPRMTAAEYCSVNGLGDLESTAIMYLAAWVYGYEIGPGGVSHRMVWNAIEDILLNRYGVGA